MPRHESIAREQMEHQDDTGEHGAGSRAMLVVVGTGIQAGGQATLAAGRAIERADRVLFAVVDPLTVAWVRSLHPGAESLPYPMDDTPRRQTYLDMVERILAELRKGLRVCAVFYGHPGMLTLPAHEAVARARREGFRVRMLPGVSALDCLIADLGVDPGLDGCQMYEATDFLIRGRGFDAHVPLVLWQVGFIGNLGFFDERDRAGIARGLAILTEALLARYAPEHEVVLYEAAVLPTDAPRMERVALADLARATVTDLTTLYVPPRAPAAVDETMLARLGMDLPRGQAPADPAAFSAPSAQSTR
jgi:precorrin-3B methylase